MYTAAWRSLPTAGESLVHGSAVVFRRAGGRRFQHVRHDLGAGSTVGRHPEGRPGAQEHLADPAGRNCCPETARPGATLLLDGGGLVVGVVNPGESRARRFSRPVELFVGWESSSAFLLIAAAVAALVWANASDSYGNLWDAHASLEVGRLHLEESLRHWVNDLLMAVFFFVVALEVKRELLFGSLSDGRSALVPAAAAFGTMIGAATVYLAVNTGG